MNDTILSPEQVALLLKSIPGGVGFLRLVQQGEWKAYFCPSCGIFYDICRNDVRNEGICKYCRWDEDAAIQAEFDRWLSTQPICPFCDEPDPYCICPEESEYTDPRDCDIWEAAPAPVESDLKEVAP